MAFFEWVFFFHAAWYLSLIFETSVIAS